MEYMLIQQKYHLSLMVDNDNCINKDHVLCIQDTVEVNYANQPERKFKFGKNRKIPISERQINGFMAHPGLIIFLIFGIVI